MKKFLLNLLFMALMVPWMTQAQNLGTYTTQTGVDATKWITLDATADTLLGADRDDAASAVTNIGFTFEFGEDSYTQFSVSSNGSMRLGATAISTSTSGGSFADNTNMPKISGCAKDMGTCDNGCIRYKLVGTAPARVLVVEYKMGPTYSASEADVMWQVQLHEGSNNVVLVYSSEVPEDLPTGFQVGLGTSSNDFYLIKTRSQTIQYRTSPSATTTSRWPGANRYYQFNRPVITCPMPRNLVASNFTSNSARVTWREMGTATQWIVEYDTVGFQLGSGRNTVVVTDTAYNFTDLTPDTEYDVYVRALCGAGDSSFWRQTSFRTLCVDVTADDLPYTENFESYTASSSINSFFNPCWTRYSTSTSTTSIYPYVASAGNSKTMYMYGTTTIKSVLAMPEFEVELNTLQLSFDIYRNTTSGVSPLLVGITTNPSNLASFDTLAVITCASHARWEHIEIPLAGYTGQGTFITFMTPDSTVSYNYIDNVTVYAPSESDCSVPTNVVANNITDNSAVINWTDEAGQAWLVEYGPAGFALGTGTMVEVSETAFMFEEGSLAPSTGYDVYIRTICNDEPGDYSIHCFFKTLKTALAAVPFVENFDGYGFGQGVEPGDWWIAGGHTRYPEVSASKRYNGIASMYMYASTSSSSPSTPWMVTPPIDIASHPFAELEVSFRMLATSSSASYPNTLIVGVATDTADLLNTFTPLDTVASTASGIWEEFTISLQGGPATAKHVVFFSKPISTSTSTRYNQIYVDNVVVDYIPDCRKPRDLTTANATETNLTVKWTPSETSHSAWDVIYGPVGFNPDATEDDGEETIIGTLVENITNDSVDLELTGGVMYDFYVRTNCNGEGSAWTGPISGGAGIYALPETGMDTMRTCSAILVDHGGASGNYDNNCSGYITIYPASPDSVMAVVSATVSSETNYDFLEVFDGMSVYGTPLYSASGSATLTDTIRSMSGPLTIRFRADGSNVGAGFQAVVACVAAASCPAVNNVTVEAIAGRSALVRWEYSAASQNDPSSFELELFKDGVSVAAYSTTETYYMLSGLDPQSNYGVRIKASCAAVGEEGIADSVAFTTKCLVGGPVEVAGATSTTTSSVPLYSYYDYSYSQQLYEAELFNGPATLNNISFEYTSTAGSERFITVYLGHTNRDEITSSSYIAPNSLSVVYCGEYEFVRGWNTINFDTPFNYDGTSNLVVAVYDSTGDGGSWLYFRAHSISGKAIYEYQNEDQLDLSMISPYSTSYRNNVKFGGNCNTAITCVAPNVQLMAIDTNSAEFIWAPGNTETSWALAYRAVGDTLWTTANANCTTTSYTFTGLTDGIDYEFRFTSTCGNTSAQRIVEATTPCRPIGTYPFTENFDEWLTGSNAEWERCWDRYYSGTSPYPYVTTGSPYSSPNYLYFYQSGSNQSGLILPKFSLPLDTLQITFAMKATSASYAFNVGVMSDPDDIATFTPLGTAVASTTTDWEMFEFPLAGSPIKDGYIAIFAGGGSYSYPYLDNVEVNPIPTCPRPRNVRIPSETITQTSAVVVWSDTNSSSWTVEYGPIGFVRGTGTTISVSDTTCTLNGLSAMTRYDVYVTGHCSSTDQSLPSFMKTFVTECGTISNFPFTESFLRYSTGTSSSIPHYPHCWRGGSNYQTYYPYFSSVSNDVAEYLYCYTPHDTLRGVRYTYVALPAIDSNNYNISDLMLTFRAKAGSSGSNYDQKLYIGVMTDPSDISTFTDIDTLDLNGGTSWVNVDEMVLSSYTGTGNYLAFAVRPDVVGYSSIYLDDIELDIIPTCYRPNEISVTDVTATSIELSWNERNNATSWVIEYDTMGFYPGTGTTVTVNTNPYTITGLTANTAYDFYVKSVCSATDESHYARVRHFTTSQVPATIPYTYNFEDGAEWANWGTTSNHSKVNWYRGTAAASEGTHSMYVSADKGESNTTMSATINTAAYRDFNFGNNDTNFIVTFRAKAGGSPEASYDGLIGILANPATLVESSSTAITSPWGHVNTVYRLGGITVRMDTAFTEYTMEIDSVSGIQRLAFFYFNQSTSFVGGPAAVDDINIDVASCPRPRRLTVINFDATSANLTWSGTASGYWFYYREANQTTMDSIYTTSNSIALTGLMPDGSYVCAVKAVCGNELSNYSDNVSFATPQVPAQLPYFCGFEPEEDETSEWGINNGTATNKWFIDTVVRDSGMYSLYISNDSAASHKYTISQASVAWAYRDFFFPNATANDTFEINFRWKGKGESSYDYIRMYIGEPAATTAGSGSITAPSGATQIAQINGVSDFETKRIYLTGDRFGGRTQRIYIAWRNDGSIGTQPPGAIDNFRILSPVAGCLPPVAVITPASTTAEFAFDVQGTYGMSCAVTGTAEWSEEQIAVDALTYTFTGLAPETTYEYRVRRICDSVTTSSFAQGTFTTTELPCVAPTGFTASDITMTSATVAWVDSLANQEAWKVAYGYGNDASGWDTIDVTTPTVNLTGLFNNTEYTVRVRAYCSVEADVYGEWSEGFTFRTATCATVSNITSSAVTNSGATISWTPGASETKWEIAYGIEGFNESTVTPTVVEGTPSYTITGLESDFTYDVYVRAVCAEGVTSAWSNKIQFRTTVGINTASTDNVRVQIYPNPANSEATVSVDGINGKVEFVVADMNGRMIVTETINCEGSLVKTIDVSNLAKGAYFVHIYNDDFNTTRKLIVK